MPINSLRASGLGAAEIDKSFKIGSASVYRMTKVEAPPQPSPT